jgi:hypothetical protein
MSRKTKTSPVETFELSKAHKRVMAAVREKGFRKFGNYLASRTVKDDSSTWSLSDMARELEVNVALFVSYHTSWIRLKREGLV